MLDGIGKGFEVWSAAVTNGKTAGRGNNGKTKAYGVKKLRELILDLAVRGMLVPQDPDDEPASVLLEKVAEERERLLEEGEIKKQKPLPGLNEPEVPFTLPDGWKWTRLGNLSADVHYGYTASANPQLQDVRLLRITDIQDNIVDWPSVPGCDIDQYKVGDYQLQDGDILIARTGGTIGKSYLVSGINLCSVFASYLIRVRYLEGMCPPYIKTFLGSQLYWGQLYANSMGTGQPNVNGNALKNLKVPLPPLAEQHRIVAKVDELMALCDALEAEQRDSIAAHEGLVECLLATLTAAEDAHATATAWRRIAHHVDTLFTTEHSIDQLKQCILQLAVMGKLVPQDPADEPASVLLERIADLRRSTNCKEYSIVSHDDTPFTVPYSWVWTRLGNISMNSDSGWSPQCGPQPRANNQWGVLKVSAVTWGEFRPEENKALPSGLDGRPECEVRSGDFLLSRANTAELVARSVVVDETEPKLMMSDKIVRFTLPDEVDRRFINMANLSDYARAYYARNASGTSSSMRNVGRIVMCNLPLPLPPLAEQHRIVAKVDELMALCDALKARLREAQTTQVHLADAAVTVDS